MPLSEILRGIQEQSGNTIVDYRRQFGQPETDPKLTVSFDKTPFWPALDQLMDQAGLTLYPYGQQRAVGLVARRGGQEDRPRRPCELQRAVPLRAGVDRRPPRSAPAGGRVAGGDSRSGLGAAAADHQPDASHGRRAAVDERGEPLPVADREAQPEVPTSGEATAVKLELPLQLPPREVRQIASLQGQAAGHNPRPDRNLPFRQAGRREERPTADRRRHGNAGAGPKSPRS